MKTDSSNYAISFHFVKRNGISKDNLKGTHSFELEFAVKDNENKLSWKIDGWQRLTTLNGIIHGSVCDLGLYYFEAEKEKEYEAKLLVKGNHVQTYIDDVLYCDHICKKAVPELLYYSAVKENKGTVIVKTVNVEAKEKELFMTFSENESEKWSKVHIFAMEGFLPDDRNSLDSPCKVVPKEKIEVINGNGYQYILQGNSFTVFRFEK